MKIFQSSFLLFLAGGMVCLAQDDKQPLADADQVASPFHRSWRELRRKQARDLDVKLTLPKNHFHVGEVIYGTLTVINPPKDNFPSPPEYVEFYAVGKDGVPVVSPLQWHDAHFRVQTGAQSKQRPGGGEPWTFTFPINHFLKFAEPGVYTLHGTYPDPRDFDETRDYPDLASNLVEITIEPRVSPDEEKAIITQAEQALLAQTQEIRQHWVNHGDELDGYPAAYEALERLRFLDTPEAANALLPFVGASEEAMLGLYARPDYPALAARILAAVKEGRLALSEKLLDNYWPLKWGTNYLPELPPSGGTPEADGRELREAARRAVTTAPDATSDTFFTNLLTLFCRDPRDAAIRAVMIKRQLDLPPKVMAMILGEIPMDPVGWAFRELLVDKDFLPLLRASVKPEIHNPHALAALKSLSPEEAQPLIMEDIRRDVPLFVVPLTPPENSVQVLLTLPPGKIVALDSVFREKLSRQADAPAQLEATMALVERYGTEALLPDVIRTYETHQEFRGSKVPTIALRFWLRHDPAAAVKALGRTLQTNRQSHWDGLFCEALQSAWVDEAMPLVLAAVKDPDPWLVQSATFLLLRQPSPENIETVVAAIQRVATQPPPEDADQRLTLRGMVSQMTRSLLLTNRHLLTESQIKRLQKVTTDPEVANLAQSLLLSDRKK